MCSKAAFTKKKRDCFTLKPPLPLFLFVFQTRGVSEWPFQPDSLSVQTTHVYSNVSGIRLYFQIWKPRWRCVLMVLIHRLLLFFNFSLYMTASGITGQYRFVTQIDSGLSIKFCVSVESVCVTNCQRVW